MQDRVEEKDYILKKLADFARERVDMAKRKVPSEEIRKRAYELPKGTFAFKKIREFHLSVSVRKRHRQKE